LVDTALMETLFPEFRLGLGANSGSFLAQRCVVESCRSEFVTSGMFAVHIQQHFAAVDNGREVMPRVQLAVRNRNLPYSVAGIACEKLEIAVVDMNVNSRGRVETDGK